MGTRCTEAVWGSELHALLQNGGCNQVIRGLYTDRDARWIGQVTIFNLQNASASRSLVTHLESHHDTGFVFPLTGSNPPDRLGRGFSEAWASVYGHYVLVTWEQRTDGTKPSEQDTDLNSVDFAFNSSLHVLFDRKSAAPCIRHLRSGHMPACRPRSTCPRPTGVLTDGWPTVTSERRTTETVKWLGPALVIGVAGRRSYRLMIGQPESV
jgi:hypothetical protein